MLKGFWKLTWVETKVFLREPMGVVASLGVPVAVFIILGRSIGREQAVGGPGEPPPFNVPVLAALLIAASAVVSLVAVISIYREGGILKRLRATPLSPVTILGAQVAVKLLFTLLGLVLVVLAGRRMMPGAAAVNLPGFAAALLLSTLSILSVGFLIASVVPTARFAQPVTAGLLYPMIAVSGLFFPLELLSPPLEALALAMPTTHAVTLMLGVWEGRGWSAESTAALVLIFVVSTALSTRLFRWQ